jgi:hypothetical protein
VIRGVLAFVLALPCLGNAADATFTLNILTPETALKSAQASLKI